MPPVKHSPRQYLERFESFIDTESLKKILTERDSWLTRESVKKFNEHLAGTPNITTNHFQIQNGWVEIGTEKDLSTTEQEKIIQCLHSLAPWRKGPFRLFGVDIDAEWRSDQKWDRLCEKIDSLEGKNVCDIGCHNGYYMFRMLEQNPAFVLGIDPIPKLYYQFHIFKKFIDAPSLHFEFLGVEHLLYFRKLFDVVFCMGILYHRKNPLETLQTIRDSMAPNGQLIIESAGIPGSEPICLCPEDSYGKAKNIYFMPTVSCMKNWLIKTGFKDIQVIYSGELTFEEQRSTAWCQSQSLEDFTSSLDPTKTIEGYPSPIRMILTARNSNQTIVSKKDS